MPDPKPPIRPGGNGPPTPGLPFPQPGDSCPLPKACSSGGLTMIDATCSSDCGGANLQRCACLAGAVDVPLMDGRLKAARDISVGDILETRTTSGELVESRVVETYTGFEQTIEIVHDLGSFQCSFSHELFTYPEGVVAAAQLDCEQHALLGRDGRKVEILNLRIAPQQEVFGWTCEPYHSFIATGVVHHNKNSTMPIGPL